MSPVWNQTVLYSTLHHFMVTVHHCVGLTTDVPCLCSPHNQVCPTGRAGFCWLTLWSPFWAHPPVLLIRSNGHRWQQRQLQEGRPNERHRLRHRGEQVLVSGQRPSAAALTAGNFRESQGCEGTLLRKI